MLGYAAELGLLEANPVDAFRAILRRKTRTQRGRAESDPARNIRPIEDPGEIEKLVNAAQEEGAEAYLLILLLPRCRPPTRRGPGAALGRGHMG